MPYKSQKIRLSPSQDRRRKLTEEDKDVIRHRYKIGDGSQRSLAREYGVNKSTIAIIVNPERANYVKQRTKEHWKDYRPSKEEWAETMREYRRYKQDLYLKGELGNETIGND